MIARSRLLFALFACTLGAGCGSGLAGILSSNDSGSTSNAPPALSAFAVPQSKTSPATITFRLADAEANAATVELFFTTAQGMQSITQLVGRPNPDSYDTTSAGQDHTVTWDFTNEPALAAYADGSYAGDISVFAVLPGGLMQAVPGASAFVGLGNDLPVVADPEPPATEEVDGVVPIDFAISDSSSDLVDVQVDYAIVVTGEPLDWIAATPAGSEPNPVPNVETSPNPTVRTFFWDTDVDLQTLERNVVVRFTPIDDVGEGVSVQTDEFRVDNNEEPSVVIQSDQVVLNPDELRGIPIPYVVRDTESDPVRVVFQWRRLEESFDDFPLPDSRAEIEATLADPVLRRELHICTEYPRRFGGQAVQVDETTLRLPELASTASPLLAGGLIGQELEILRPKNKLVAVSEHWKTNPLEHPVGALPLNDGLTTLVLDRPSPGSWRLSEIELATGEVMCVVATSTGEPTALAEEVGTPRWPKLTDSVLVASDVNGTWRVERIVLGTCPGSGAVTTLVTADASTELGSIRSLASLGRGAALITVGNSLIRLDFADSVTPRQVVLFDDLATPWGVVCDPLHSNRIYVAEHTAPTPSGVGRILLIELDTRSRSPLEPTSSSLGQPALPRPSGLALEQGGSRILVACAVDPTWPRYALRAVETRENSPVHSVREELLSVPTSIAVGVDSLRLVTFAESGSLSSAGGIEQRRVIASLDTSSGSVQLERPIQPESEVSSTWRLHPRQTQGSPDGVHGVFTWDSRDAVSGPVFFKATPVDEESGAANESGAPKQIKNSLGAGRIVGGSPATDAPFSVIAADLDLDGDTDIASANNRSDTVTIFFQESPGVFAVEPVTLGEALIDGPRAIAAADLDQDGDIDIVSANVDLFGLQSNLTVFFQESPGTFSSVPLTLSNSSVLGPRSVATADLDQDGDTDIVSANELSNNLTVFFQDNERPGSFTEAPLAIGSFPTTHRPFSITTADIDEDGDIDLISANLSGDSLTVFYQEGPGSFSTDPLTIGQVSGPKSVAVGDLDQDGDLDVISANSGSDNLTAFFQEDSGVFATLPLTLEGFPVTISPSSVALGDVDGDGDTDIIAASLSSDNVTVFFQEAPGVFAPSPLDLHGSLMDGPNAVAVVDLDHDGDIDLLSANIGSDNVTAFFQDGPGAFMSEPLLLGNLPLTQWTVSVTNADLDQDGDLDIVSANVVHDTLTVFFQESPGIFESEPLALTVPGTPRAVAAADIDQDGDVDLVSANELGDNLSVFFQTSPGSFERKPLTLGGPHVTDGPQSVALADLDKDGDVDVISANRFGNNLSVFLQEGGGVFAATPVTLGGLSTTGAPFSVAVADLNQDGELDIVSANIGSNNLSIFFQEGPGVFTITPLLLESSQAFDGPFFVATADLDQDGDADIVSANEASDNLTVFFQEGPGVFATEPLMLGDASTGQQPRSVATTDFDLDGDIDIVSANEGGNNLTVFFQEAPGVFREGAQPIGGLPQTIAPVSLTAADFDQDGEIDIVSANRFSGLTIFWGGR